MKPSEILSEKPRAKTLFVYYGAALFIMVLSSLGVIASWPGHGDAAVNMAVSLAGLIGGLILFASVVCIHLEMSQAVYAVTATSAHARWGLLFKHDESIQLGAVRSIRVSQGPLQRLFKLGDLVLYTTSNDVLVFWDIAHPVEKKELIWGIVQSAAAQRPSRYVPDK